MAAEDNLALQQPRIGKIGSWVIAVLRALVSCSGKLNALLIPRASPVPVYTWLQLFLFMFALHSFFPLNPCPFFCVVHGEGKTLPALFCNKDALLTQITES